MDLSVAPGAEGERLTRPGARDSLDRARGAPPNEREEIEVDVAGSVRVRFTVGTDVEYVTELIKRLR